MYLYFCIYVTVIKTRHTIGKLYFNSVFEEIVKNILLLHQ